MGGSISNIEVGEYVRTRDGRIFKVDAEKKNIEINEFMNMRGDKDIVNHSKELIDLIEKDDFVNGKRVIKIMDYEEFKKICFDEDFDDVAYEEDIKSIVTWEMMKSVEYRVE